MGTAVSCRRDERFARDCDWLARMLVEVASFEELTEGVGTVVITGGREIMVIRWRGEVYAIRNVCPHMSAPFSVANRANERGGSVVHARISGGKTFGELVRKDEPLITCPWHTWSFSLRDGSCMVDPELRVKAYKVMIEAGKVYLDMGRERKSPQRASL
jgi:nitrite reductase (NADH) small subunit